MERIPFFTTKPIQDGEEVSPEIAAMQALRYEDENPTGLYITTTYFIFIKAINIIIIL